MSVCCLAHNLCLELVSLTVVAVTVDLRLLTQVLKLLHMHEASTPVSNVSTLHAVQCPLHG